MKKCKQCGKNLIRNPKWSARQWSIAKFCNRICMGKSRLGMKFPEQWRKNIQLSHKINTPEQDDIRKKARAAVTHALRNGKLKRPISCEALSISSACFGRLEAHHPDYSKPLKIKWLCDAHHKRLHKVGEEKFWSELLTKESNG